MIGDALVPALERAFPGRGLRVTPGGKPVAVFPAACPEVGDLMIYDDGEEATVLIENVTHHHSRPYDQGLTADALARWVAEDVVAFLTDLFADEVLLWAINKGQGGGGWRRGFRGTVPADIPVEAEVFVWSRCIERAG